MPGNKTELEKLIENRLVSADKNTLYKMLVDGMYQECEGILSDNVINNMKNDAINILLNLVQYAFSSGITDGVKLGLKISKQGVPIIREQSEKIGHKKMSSKGGKVCTSIYSLQRKQAEEIFVRYRIEHAELLSTYKNNPNKNMPKTVLRRMLENEINLARRTLGDWTKELLENDGKFKTRI